MLYTLNVVWRILWLKCIGEVCIPRATCVFFTCSLSGRESKPIWTFLQPAANASQQVSPVKGENVTGWDIYALLTHVIQILYQEFSLCETPAALSLVHFTSIFLLQNSLVVAPPLWFVAVKQVETPTVAQSQLNWMLSEVMVIIVATETREDTSTFPFPSSLLH